MIGVQFDSPHTAEAVQWQAFQRGLLVLEAGDDCVRLSPPLTVSADEVRTAVRLFDEAVGDVAADPEGTLRQAQRWGEEDVVGG
jgi:4-aminobutyrate aminotransferase